MTARRRNNMRRLVDNTLALVRVGELSAELAAHKLHENGVPMAVIGRVLSDLSSAQPCTAAAPSGPLEPKSPTKTAMVPGHSGWRQGGWVALAPQG